MNFDNEKPLPQGDILVVEDNMSHLKFISEILTNAGYRVRPASDGELALRSLQAKLPDLILLDIRMPGMDGIEVCHRLKADPSTRDVPVIFISSLGETNLKVKALEAGGIDYVTKPINPSEVLARVNTHLNMYQLQQKLAAQYVKLMEETRERRKVEKKKKNLEAQLQQAQRMEAIGVLASGVAHDFNNLLTIILGNTGLMLMDNCMDNSTKEILKEIDAAGKKAVDLVRQLLAFSRKQVIQPQVLRLNILLKNTEKMLNRLISENIEIKMIQDPELWKIKIDPGQVDQVVMNLAGNARDAMPEGGRITFETANVDLDNTYFNNRGMEPKPGLYVMLAVSDTGHGMDKKTLQHIFEPFFTTKEIGKGTGLGLSTVYGIIEQNKGFIRIKSDSGQGTTFKIYLPKEKGEKKTKENKRNGKPGLTGSETIFIVEALSDKMQTLH